MLTSFQPFWFLLLIPAAVVCLLWSLPTRLLRSLRAGVFVLIILALCQLAVRLPDKAGTLVVVADRSDSMPGSAPASEKEILSLLYKSMSPRDQLGVVSFGRFAAIEQPPQHTEFSGFTASVGSDHSSLNSAIEMALQLVPPDSSGRILLLTDGKWTGQNPLTAAARAAGQGLPIDYRLLSRPQAGDVAIQAFQAPQSVLPEQAFLLTAWIQTPHSQELSYELRRGDQLLASGKRQLPAGLSRLLFRDRAPTTGLCSYTLTVQGKEADPLPENNSARALVQVDSARPLLVVSQAGEHSGLVQLLRHSAVDVLGKTPLQCKWSLEELAQFSGVIIENVPASRIGMQGMETLALWVQETGSGLALTGGQNTYGPGGYFKSPLERILPVSMEMRREHRKLNVAVVVALDRSGSMAMPAGGGRKKIDLADLGTVQVLDLLSPQDELGVFAVDTVAHEIVPLDTVENNAGYRGKILAIDSQGGGIYIYEALVACARMIASAHAATKHIILFADASDSEQSAHYQEIVDKLVQAGVTISVVGLGTDHDCDANLLKDIARRGGGECYFSDNPDEIPRIFAQDTFTIARSTFVEEATPFEFTPGYALLGSPPPTVPPPLGGYNHCYLRPQANLAAVTRDEYKAPVVATWNAGTGRVLCYLGEADGPYSGQFAHWDQASAFYSTLARWLAGRRQPLPPEMFLAQDILDGTCVVQLHLDPARKAELFSALPQIHVLHASPGKPPFRELVPLQWKTADLLEAAIPLAGNETLLNTVEIAGQQPVTLPPVCLPYSPEFAPEQTSRGAATLSQIAQTTDGKERLEIPTIWKELPVKSRYVELTPWLLILASAFFLLEILERRTGWISARWQARPISTPETTQPGSSSTPAMAAASKPFVRLHTQTSSKSQLPTQSASSPASSPGRGHSTPEPSPSDTFEALRQARQKAQQRTGPKR